MSLPPLFPMETKQNQITYLEIADDPQMSTDTRFGTRILPSSGDDVILAFLKLAPFYGFSPVVLEAKFTGESSC